MPLLAVSGDPLLTRAHTLAFGHNARGRTELGPLETLLLNRYPAAFAMYGRRCQSGRIVAGEYWIWRESQPCLAFLVVRNSSVSAARLRHVQMIALALARDYALAGIHSLALAPLAAGSEWPPVQLVLEESFARSALPVILYQSYRPGVQADESPLLPE
jgi:hypothetical protein